MKLLPSIIIRPASLMEDADGVLSFDFEGVLDVPPAVISSNGGGPQAVSTLAAAALGQPNASATASADGLRHGQGGRRNFRQTVCRHWLRGLCMKGELCGFLHQLDRGRMPVCRFYAKYGECREPDCIYKHTNEDIKECNMYMLGFCPNGPDCRYRHVKLPGPVPSVEESLQKIQQRVATANGSSQHSRYTGQRRVVSSSQEEAQPWPPAVPSSRAEVAAATGEENLQQMQLQTQEMHQQQLPPPPPPPLPPLPPPPQQRPQGPQQPQVTLPNQALLSSPQTMANGLLAIQPSTSVSASSPLPQGYSRYFIVKSCNRENLELSVMRGMWATHRNNEAKLNDAFDSCDNVILVFSVNEARHFQGCARMMSKIGVIVGGGSWKYANGTAHYGRNFRLKWLKLCELSFHKTRHLRNSYNENLPVKISRDCQELEPTVGEQLASLLYMEPDSDLMKAANEVEAKWEEEKIKGSGSVKEPEDATFVPFDEVDEDQDEEESDEDDSSSQTASQSKGMLSGGRGARVSLGQAGRGSRGRERGSPSDALPLGYDRFAGNAADRFGLPGTAVGRGFRPYHPLTRYGGPDFSSLRAGSAVGFGHMDGSVPPSGMAFSVRPPSNGMFPHNGLGIMGPPGAALMAGVGPMNMITASRPHFMGSQGAGRHSRPVGFPFRPPQNGGSGGRGRRGSYEQQRRQRNEKIGGGGGGDLRNAGNSGKHLRSVGGASGLGEVETQQGHDGVLAKNSFDKEGDSSSEDEAPRRSRYGEGKKRRRAWQGEDISAETWEQQTPQGDQWVGTDQMEVAY